MEKPLALPSAVNYLFSIHSSVAPDSSPETSRDHIVREKGVVAKVFQSVAKPARHMSREEDCTRINAA